MLISTERLDGLESPIGGSAYRYGVGCDLRTHRTPRSCLGASGRIRVVPLWVSFQDNRLHREGCVYVLSKGCTKVRSGAIRGVLRIRCNYNAP